MLLKGKLYICTVGLCRRKGGEESAAGGDECHGWFLTDGQQQEIKIHKMLVRPAIMH